MPWLKKVARQIWHAVGDQRGDDDHGGQRECDGQTAGVFWPKPVSETEDQQHASGGKGDVVFEKLQPVNVFGAGNNISQTGPTTERGCHREVSDQKQRTNYGEQSSLRSRRRINAAAIRKISADDRVVDSDQTSQHADREND